MNKAFFLTGFPSDNIYEANSGVVYNLKMYNNVKLPGLEFLGRPLGVEKLSDMLKPNRLREYVEKYEAFLNEFSPENIHRIHDRLKNGTEAATTADVAELIKSIIENVC